MRQETDGRVMLIVGGTLNDRALLRGFFADEYDVFEAGDDRAAREYLRVNADAAVVLADARCDLVALSGLCVPLVATAADADEAERALTLGAADVLVRPFSRAVARRRVENAVRIAGQEEMLRAAQYDDKSGLPNRQAFCLRAAAVLRENPDGRYVLIRWDVDRFKVYNDIYGSVAGDAFLRAIGEFLRGLDGAGLFAHYEADHFVALLNKSIFEPERALARMRAWLAEYQPSFKFRPCMGIYPVPENDGALDVGLMCDRALLALRSVKNGYARDYAWYDESMRAELIAEQEIVSEMAAALADGQFLLYIQPQYNCVTGELVGGEALVRWMHPRKGMISPGRFIPVFERNGFITRLDEFVWERACALLRGWLDEGVRPAPLSVNISRVDTYNPRLVDILLGLTEKYRVDKRLLRLEITESAFTENGEQIVEVVHALRQAGFCLEMDDFGSGYSSLNTLKTLPVDVLKLDMQFLAETPDDGRGGVILNSVVRMAHWLNLPVIAEGVETARQADYLKTIGCELVQGYLYARPMPEPDYAQLLREARQGDALRTGRTRSLFDNREFWNPEAQATAIFNSFVGAAGIFEYHEGDVELLRVNDKFFEEMRLSRDVFDGQRARLSRYVAQEDRHVLTDVLDEAVRTDREGGCEMRLRRGDATMWVRLRVRVIARGPDRQVIYAAFENITERKRLSDENAELSSKLSGVIGSVPGGIGLIALSDPPRVDYFNSRMGAMFGYTRSEFVERFAGDMLRAVHPEDRPAVRRRLFSLKDAPEETRSVVYRHLRKSGEYHWVRLTARLLPGRADGEATASVILMDIEREKKTEALAQAQNAALEKQRKYLQSLYDTIPCGICHYAVSDGKWTPRRFNDAQYVLYGYADRAAFLRVHSEKGFGADIVPEDAAYARAQTKRVLLTGERADMECRVRGADGARRWVRILADRIADESGEWVLQVVSTDITARKQDEVRRYARALFTLFDEVCQIDFRGDTYMVLSSRYTANSDASVPAPLAEGIDRWCGRVAGEDAPALCAFFEKARSVPADSEEPCRLEFRLPDQAGRVRWIAATLLRVAGDTMLLCSRDITEEKNAREDATMTAVNRERRADDERNRLLIERAGSVLFEYDPQKDQMRYQVNAPGKGLVTHALPEYLAHVARDTRVHPEYMRDYAETLRRACAAPGQYTLEYMADLFDQGYRWCRANCASVADGEGRVYRVVGMVDDIQADMERDRLLSALQRRLRGGDDTRNVAERVFSVLYEASDVPEAISAILAAIGENMDVSRAYILEESDDHARASNTFEWTARGVAPQMDNLRDLEYPPEYAGGLECLFEDGIMRCDDVAGMTPCLRDILDMQGIKAILLCAIMDDGHFRGYVGFDECRAPRRWRDGQVHTLKIVSRLMGMFLLRRREETQAT